MYYPTAIVLPPEKEGEPGLLHEIKDFSLQATVEAKIIAGPEAIVYSGVINGLPARYVEGKSGEVFIVSPDLLEDV